MAELWLVVTKAGCAKHHFDLEIGSAAGRNFGFRKFVFEHAYHGAILAQNGRTETDVVVLACYFF